MSRRFAIPALCLVSLVLTLALPVAQADDTYAVRAFLDPEGDVTETQPVRLVILIESERNPTVTPPRFGKLQNLSILSGPNTKTNMSWINGRTTSKLELSYTLLPEGPGPAAIPALELSLEGQTYRTQPFAFNVKKAPAGKPTAPSDARSQRPQDDPSVIYLTTELGADEAWVGQPISLDVTLYSVPRVTGFVWRRQPDFANFWVENVQFDPEADARRIRADGRVFTAFPMDRKVLIPPSPGTFDIESYVGQIQVRVNRDNPSDWFRFGRSEQLLRKSEARKLKVKPLPQEGRPDDFNGAVGSYRLEVSLDRNEARVNDAVALRAVVRGEGALRSVGAPTFTVPADLKLMDPRVKESVVEARNGRIESTKTWEWIVVPLSPGEMQLPAMEFHYFDPQSASYKVADGGVKNLTVLRSDQEPDTRIARGGVRLQRRDLAFIKPLRGELTAEYPRVHERTGFRILFLLPLALCPVLIVLGRRHARLAQDHGLSRGRKARTKARRRLQAARKKVEQTESATFHEEVARTLVEYLADRSNRSASGLTYDSADEVLLAKGIDDDLRRRFRSCLETCDFVRFVPEASKTERREELLTEVEQLIDELEKAW